MATIEEIRATLLTVLADDPSTIVPCVRENVLDLREQITDDMSDAELVSAIHTLVGISNEAAKYGRDDLAERLESIGDDLRDMRSAPAELDKPNGFRLGIDFETGYMSGGCSGCEADDVAEALIAIATALQALATLPGSIAYTDQGVEVGGCRPCGLN
jgi:hypothetical protein